MPEDRLPNLITITNPRSPISEAYRTLRTNLEFSSLDKPIRSMVVTSASPEEGKSTVILNLGAAISEMGKKVLLVEADLRKPALDRYFKASPGKGISNVLAGTALLEEAVQPTEYPNLYVLLSGIKPPNPAELVSSESMREVLERVSRFADFVLVDAPPLLVASDALALATKVAGVVLVAGYGKADRQSAKHAVELLRKVNARISGLVINNIAPSTRYSYYQYYYYSPPPEEEPPRGLLSRLRKR